MANTDGFTLPPCPFCGSPAAEPAPATVDRDAVLREAISACESNLGVGSLRDDGVHRCVTSIEVLKGKAATAPVAVAPVAGEGLTDEQRRTLERAASAAEAWGNTELAEKVRVIATQAERQPQPAAQAAVPDWKSIADQLNALSKAMGEAGLTPKHRAQGMLYAILHEVCAAPAAVPQGGKHD